MARLKIWDADSAAWRYVDYNVTTASFISSSYAITSSYALNGGGSSLTASYFNEASASLLEGSLYLRSNSGSLWKITVFEDGDHVGTLQLEGPY